MSDDLKVSNGGHKEDRVKRSYPDDFEQELQEEESAPSASKLQRRQPCYAVYRKAQQNSSSSSSSTTTSINNKLTEEMGLIHDFKCDFHYVLTTLLDEKSTVNLKNLSLTQLLKKSVMPEFRDFLRLQSAHLNRLFTSLVELSDCSMPISLSSACLLYFMARDRKGVPVFEKSVPLIAALLKQDQQRAKSDEEYKKHAALVWSIIQDWLRVWQKKSSKSIKLDVNEENLSVQFLALEALAYVALREQSKAFKEDLFKSGCLTSIVAKLDKVVLELVHSTESIAASSALVTTTTTGTRLKVVERCFRILENAAAFDAKNQVFLLQHRNNLLIFSCAKFLNFSLQFVESAQQQQQQRQNDCNKIYECICLLCRVLMNVSHDNENASFKIGQVAGFLQNCLHVLAKHSGYAPKEKFFDVAVMMYGLLVNLVERCPANRRKFLALKSEFLDRTSNEEDCVITECASLDILTKLFIRHDSAAKVIDEEFDNDLLADEPPPPDEDGSGNNNNNENGQQQENGANMSQDEVLAAIQSMMNKASTHMEDSMVASYCALVIAILVGTDNNLSSQVKSLLPNQDMNQMVEQLERFLEFMRITNLKASTVSNIERVLSSFRIAASL